MWQWTLPLPLLILFYRFYYRATSGVCRSKRRLVGRTAIVTGASAGIGKETARDLARRGAKVILACRNVKKAQGIADDIIATTGNGQVFVRQLDTSSLKSVNNAGMQGSTEKRLASDRLELTMATNHFGHFLLTNLLMDLLKRSAPSRIVNVTSAAHLYCRGLDVDDLNYERRPYGSAFGSYAHSKLANVLFTLELSERLRNTGVTANCVHPGRVATEIYHKDGNRILNFMAMIIFGFTGKDEVLGAQTTNYVAVSEDVNNISGEYFVDCKISSPSELAKDPMLARKLWVVSQQLVKLI